MSMQITNPPAMGRNRRLTRVLGSAITPNPVMAASPMIRPSVPAWVDNKPAHENRELCEQSVTDKIPYKQPCLPQFFVRYTATKIQAALSVSFLSHLQTGAA